MELLLSLVPDGRRQKLEVADLQLAAFRDENDFKIKIWIKILALLQVFDTHSLSLRRILKLLR
jgi:hypothetical protein